MTQRECPHCHRYAYSADTRPEVWECPHCGHPIPAPEAEQEGGQDDEL